MAKIYCPNCGSEVKLPEKSSIGIGMTISKESKGEYELPLETVRNNNMKKETKNSENKEKTNMNMNMNFDMETLAKMVAAQLKGESVVKVEQNVPKVETVAKDIRESVVKDKNPWAVNSQFHNKDICGFAFNPYMIRRFLPAQFEQLMRKYGNNVHFAITKEYSYMYSIAYTLEEVRKLAMLEKRDKIAFDERSKVFSLVQCRLIFAQYIDDVLAKIEWECELFTTRNKVGKKFNNGLKGYGWFTWGTVAEKIEKHKVVKYLEKSEELNRVIACLNDLKREISYSYKYKDLYRVMSAKPFIKVDEHTKKSPEFMDCFIKAGSYYTLKQMIMFDNVCFKGYYGRDAVRVLRNYLNTITPGYKFYAMLKAVKGIRTF